MKSVLSTKILTRAQQELLLNAGLSFTHYNGIKIDFLNFELPKDDFDFLIFTSQNGVRSYIKKGGGLALKKAFCVGEKTKFLLEKNGYKVIEMGQNSSEIAKIITKNYKNSSFLHISGNLSLVELPNMLKKNNVRYVSLTGYETKPSPKKFDQLFDGVLFFSPSGVQSFTQHNKISGTALCIGSTTAQEAEKHTDKISIAKKPTVENVIVQAVKYFDSNPNLNLNKN